MPRSQLVTQQQSQASQLDFRQRSPRHPNARNHGAYQLPEVHVVDRTKLALVMAQMLVDCEAALVQHSKSHLMVGHGCQHFVADNHAWPSCCACST